MHPYKTIAIHRLWKMAATIWRTRNQALHRITKTERTYKYKTQLDQKKQHILMHLQRQLNSTQTCTARILIHSGLQTSLDQMGDPIPQKPQHHYIKQTNHIICNKHSQPGRNFTTLQITPVHKPHRRAEHKSINDNNNINNPPLPPLLSLPSSLLCLLSMRQSMIQPPEYNIPLD